MMFSSCISKKNHYATLTGQEMKLEALRRGQVAKIQRELKGVRDSLRVIEIETATKAGSISTLENLRIEMDRKNKELEEKLELQNAQSSSAQADQNKTLKEKEQEISRLKNKIAAAKSLVDGSTVDFGTLVGDLRSRMGPYDPNLYEVISSAGSMSLEINETLLFKTGSVSKLSSDGKVLLQNVANVMNGYPTINIVVVGHTDDSKPKTGYADNWMISTVRAVGVVNVLTDNGVSQNQIMAAGKGEFAPAGSNSTPEGKTKNRRVELKFIPVQQVLAKQIKQALN